LRGCSQVCATLINRDGPAGALSLQCEARALGRVCSWLRTRSEDSVSSVGGSSWSSQCCWNWRPLSRYVVSCIHKLYWYSKYTRVNPGSVMVCSQPSLTTGSVHGQYSDLLHIFETAGFPPESSYLFLGNYVDHGRQSVETMCLLMAYKIKYPDTFFLLRGNHECAAINRTGWFYDECKSLL